MSALKRLFTKGDRLDFDHLSFTDFFERVEATHGSDK